jgi:hypothetical protein
VPDPGSTDLADPADVAGRVDSSVDVDGMPPLTGTWPRLVEKVAIVGFALLAIAFRFVTRSPLWLDEALTVNIAKLPLGRIPGALRHDGHPPLYYVLLHGWMILFGQGNLAVRSLSGVFGLALIPLMWIAGGRLAGRRGAVAGVVVVALSPYAIRYSTETRMYAMVMVLALAAWLVADDALERPTAPRLIGLTLLTAALLWSHYWSMWFLGACTLGLLVHLRRVRRAGRTDDVRSTLLVLGALVAGGVLFLPWLPSMLYQSAHTGTPWAGPVRPTEMLAQSVDDLGGGPQGEAVLLGITLVVLMLVALFGRARDRRHIDLDLTTRPEARPMMIVILGTMAIASVVAYATDSAFATRYIAVIVPLVLLTAGLGLSRFIDAWGFRVVAVLVLLLGMAGGLRNVVTDRTEAAVAAAAYRAQATTGDLVITCPDQLGPALARVLPPDAHVVTYPDFAAPQLVDWTDYTKRLARANPEAFGREALRRAGDHTIWYAWAGTYKTHKGTCERVLNTMLQQRPWATNPTIDNGQRYYEHEALWRLPAHKGG